jgi:hypothetical protein
LANHELGFEDDLAMLVRLVVGGLVEQQPGRGAARSRADPAANARPGAPGAQRARAPVGHLADGVRAADVRDVLVTGGQQVRGSLSMTGHGK